MAAAIGLSPANVYGIWSKANLKPHRLDRYMASNDPAFEEKAAEIIGLYMEPSQHAAVFCVDENTATQALDSLDPVLPFSPGRAEKHGFEYYRHGTLSLYAALDVTTGQVHGKTASRHTSADFIGLPTEIVERNPQPKELHIVLDNLSAHKTQAVKEFLEQNPRVRFHSRPARGGSIKSKSGLPKSNATSLLAASSPQWRSFPQAHEVHPSVCQIRQTLPLEIH